MMDYNTSSIEALYIETGIPSTGCDFLSSEQKYSFLNHTDSPLSLSDSVQ